MFRLTALAICIIAVAFLVGCGSADDVAGTALLNPPDVDDLGDDNGDPDGDGGGGDGGNLPHSPEPVTMVLLGGGLAAFAFLKR